MRISAAAYYSAHRKTVATVSIYRSARITDRSQRDDRERNEGAELCVEQNEEDELRTRCDLRPGVSKVA